VTYSDGVQSVTKQVTLLAQYDWEGSTPDPDDPSEISVDFTQYDRIQDHWFQAGFPLPATARVTLTIRSDGTLDAQDLNHGQDPNFPQDWHVDAPSVTNPEDYECRLTVVGDPVQAGSDLTGQWLNLSSAHAWSYFADGTDEAPQTVIVTEGQWLLEVREVGRPENMKQKQMDALAQAIAPTNGGGGPIP
jgi:hypothetical protein